MPKPSVERVSADGFLGSLLFNLSNQSSGLPSSSAGDPLAAAADKLVNFGLGNSPRSAGDRALGVGSNGVAKAPEIDKAPRRAAAAVTAAAVRKRAAEVLCLRRRSERGSAMCPAKVNASKAIPKAECEEAGESMERPECQIKLGKP
mmetsp:Transcript_64559/g.185676  ORF Transcript_64559/g.185676 Transcript_64559/m.185676 type:complete len:147 (+) Transcript_64559:470-910(+)